MFDIAFRADDLPWIACAHCRALSHKVTARECATCERPVCERCRNKHAKCPVDVEARARRAAEIVVDDDNE